MYVAEKGDAFTVEGGSPAVTILGQEIDFGTDIIITNYFKGIDILNTAIEQLVIKYYTI